MSGNDRGRLYHTVIGMEMRRFTGKAVVITGGANGIGLSIAMELSSRPTTEKVYIVDKASLSEEYHRPNVENVVFDLTSSDYSIFDRYTDIDSLMPPVSRFGGGNRAAKKQTIIEKLKAFFERFFGIS